MSLKSLVWPFRKSSPKIIKVVSANEFAELAKTSASSITRSRFVSPVIGSRDLGYFEVELKHEPGK